MSSFLAPRCRLVSASLFSVAAIPATAMRRLGPGAPVQGARPSGGRRRGVLRGSCVFRRVCHGLPRPAGASHAGDAVTAYDATAVADQGC